MCNLNKECEPTEGKHVDFLFCKKLASAEQEQCAMLRRHASRVHCGRKIKPLNHNWGSTIDLWNHIAMGGKNITFWWENYLQHFLTC